MRKKLKLNKLQSYVDSPLKLNSTTFLLNAMTYDLDSESDQIIFLFIP